MATNKTIENKFAKIIDKIRAAKTIAIFAHISYDPDCLGSMFGLARFLKKQGKSVDKFVDSKVCEIDSRIYNTAELSSMLYKDYDLMIMVDTPNIERLGQYGPAFKKHPNTIKLDHHIGYHGAAKVEVELPYASCSEVILELITRMGCKPDSMTASYLYGGLLTDTDCFSTGSVTKQTLENAVKLIECGADTKRVTDVLIKTQSLANYKLKKIVNEKAEIYEDVFISLLSLKDFKKAGAESNEDGNISNKLIYLDGINISCLIKQKQINSYSCSFRSRDGYDVAKIAEALGGGGHKQAAGAVVKGSEKTVKSLVLKAIRENRK